MREHQLSRVISAMDVVKRFAAENPAWACCCRPAL